MRGARAGNQVEVAVMRILEAQGWVCGSRRHIGGAGDLLAVMAGSGRRMLVEVKSTAQGPYERFGRTDRQDMVSLAREINAEARLAWWPPGRPLRWISADEWPVGNLPRTNKAPKGAGS